MFILQMASLVQAARLLAQFRIKTLVLLLELLLRDQNPK